MLEKIKKSKEEQREDFVKMVELRGGKYCNKCFDRGFLTWDSERGFYIPCSCLLSICFGVLKKAHHIELEKKAEL